MIIYWNKCLRCGKVFSSEKNRRKCPDCGGTLKLARLIHRTSRHELTANAHATVYSRAMAIDPSQLEEAKKIYPDENYIYNAKEGICMLEVKGAHHQAMLAKRHGMVDYSGMKVSK